MLSEALWVSLSCLFVHVSIVNGENLLQSDTENIVPCWQSIDGSTRSLFPYPAAGASTSHRFSH